MEWAGTLSSERRRQLADVIVELKGPSYGDEPSPIRSDQDVSANVNQFEMANHFEVGGQEMMEPGYHTIYAAQDAGIAPQFEAGQIRDSLKNM